MNAKRNIFANNQKNVYPCNALQNTSLSVKNKCADKKLKQFPRLFIFANIRSGELRAFFIFI
ncbi:hypothetical protein DW712_11975 [Bacteroides intestinalis]|uniref:Uncharacterized protein n=1 Tax=Bacteroides intestinalis TaxID=329854 RepID=A0A414LA79_9BACE|nr:hypothetical protein DW712_11975 [Bacteroides intestinalis]